jgi:hypothetical protein
MPYIPCDEYIGEQVYLIYYRGGWQVEQVTVSEDPYGMIYTDALLEVGKPYWVGKNFESLVKTLPIVNPQVTGKKARISEFNLYVHNSQGGVLEAGGEEYALSYPDGELYTGKIESSFGGIYTEEPQITVSTDEIYNLRILAMEYVYRQYER